MSPGLNLAHINETLLAQTSLGSIATRNTDHIPPSQSRNFAEWLSSRESLFRFGLDFTGWIIPTVLGAATRNKYSFYEALFQSGLEVIGMGFATSFTKIANFISGMIHLESDENKNLKHLMLFSLNDISNETSLDQAAQRILKEERQDLEFSKNLFKKSNDAQYHDQQNSLQNFFENFKTNAKQTQRLKKFKQGVILIDSSLQGIIWGGYFLFNRLFRKYILQQDRFTGTKAYTDDKQSKKIGDSTPLSLLQKLGIATAMLITPVMNWGVLKLIDKPELVKNNKWLQMLKNQWDVTHGIYPKLGLLWSYCFLPVTIGGLSSAQGKSEFIEQILTQLVMGNSWFFGHRFTNGLLAKFADNKLANKHQTEKGIMVEPEYLHHPFPEPAKIQHVIDRSQSNKALEKDARDEHAKVLYQGFALHSGLVLGVRLLINIFTKWRVNRELKR